MVSLLRKGFLGIVFFFGATCSLYAQNASVEWVTAPTTGDVGTQLTYQIKVTNLTGGNISIQGRFLFFNNVQVGGDATVIQLSPSGDPGDNWSGNLNFTPIANGTYTVYATAIVASAPYNTPEITVTIGPVTAENDPTQDAEVVGINNAQMASAERFMQLQTGNIRNRLRRVRSDRHLGQARDSFNFAMNDATTTRTRGQDSVSSSSAVASFGSASANASAWDEEFCSRTWSMWSESSLSTGHDHKNDNNNDYTTFGTTIGIDRYFTQCFAAGIAIGYAHDKTDVGKNGSESKANAYTAALYGSYSLPQGFFVDAAAGYSRLDYDSHRVTADGFADGDRDGNQYFASIETGFDIAKGNFLISPYGRADASTTRLDKYSERGPNAIRYDSTDINLFSLSAGVRGEYAFALCWGNLTPSAGVEYTHNFRDATNQKLGYVADGTLPYHLKSKALGVNQIAASLGLDANFQNGWSVGGKYRGTYASSRVDHTFYFGISKDW